MNKVRVNLRDNAYDILIGEGILSELGKALRRMDLPPRVIVISDYNVGKIYSSVLRHSLRAAGFKVETLLIPPGERQKSLKNAEKLYHNLARMKISKDSTIISLGGGVVGDLAGFVASTYMRGITLIHVPTTLLSMVDASIGGKTAVNLEEGKNLVGVFYQPKLVFCDVSSLLTLPQKEMRNGLAEIIKYGVIRDPSLFDLLEKHVSDLKRPKLDRAADFKGLMHIWVKIIKDSAAIKARIVELDEKEQKGLRMLLNFGHTIGHAIESLSEYRGASHGEAVAIGMVAASRIAYKLKMIGDKQLKRITDLIATVNLPLTISRKIEAEDILAKLILDKKVRDGKINFVLPLSIGSVKVRDDVPVKILREALKETGAK